MKIKLCFCLLLSILIPFALTVGASPIYEDPQVQMNNLCEYYLETYGDMPEYYAGAYLNSENKSLTICVKATNFDEDLVSKYSNEIQKAVKSENVKVDKKEYSYNELEAIFIGILDKSMKLYQEYKDSGNDELLEVFKYIGGGLDVKENRINIRIIDINDKKIEIFKKYISDFENIFFMNSEDGMVEQASTFKTGQMITINANRGTLGFRVKATDPDDGAIYRGFLTAAHNSNSNNQTVYNSSGSSIGTVVQRKYTTGSNCVDAAFVKLLSQSDTVSDTTLYGNRLIVDNFLTKNGYIQEKEVWLNGAGDGVVKFEREIAGIIKEVDGGYTDNILGQSYYNLVAYAADTHKGDSGGGVYTLISGDYARCGLHKGKDGRAYFTKYQIMTDSGLYVYMYS